MLNSIGERTEPCACGTPFFILLSLLRCPSLVCTMKLRFDNISMMKPTMCLSGMVLSSFRWSPRCHMVSYTAVKSRNNTPAFSLCWNLSSMYCVSSVTWSTVDLPRRKPACSRGSCGSMRLCINLSRILNGTQSSEMGLYDFGSCAGLLGFGRDTTVARRHVSLYLRLTSCLSLSLYLSISPYVLVSLSLSVSLIISLSLFLSRYLASLSLSLSLSLSDAVSLYVSMCLSLPLSFYLLSLSLYRSLPLSRYLSISLFVCLSFSLCISISPGLSLYLHVSLYLSRALTLSFFLSLSFGSLSLSL